MTIKIKHKRGTASNITSANPTLAAGELAFETDTRRFKVGDGTTAWSSLSYVTPYVTATDRILGRSSAGAGSAEELTCTAAGRALLSGADAAAQRTTLSVQPTASPAFTGTVSAAAANFTGAVSVTSPLTLTGTVAGNVRQIKMQTSGVDRWQITPSFDAETGSNAGSNFHITRWSDAGSFMGTPLYITRSTGVVNCESGLTIVSGQLLVTAGSASACGVAFSGDTNTGLAQIGGADTASLVTAGVERVRCTSGGTIEVRANSGSISHGLAYNENGGEIVLYDETQTAATLIDQISTDTRVLELVNGSNLKLGLGGSNTTGLVQFMRAGYQEAMRIDASGNVGIGNIVPAYRFEVRGAGAQARFYNSTTDAVVFIQGLTPASPWFGAGKSACQIDVDGWGGFAWQTDVTSGAKLFKLINNGGYGASESTVLTVNASGSVGIGVTPAANTTSNVQASGDITLYGASRGFLGNMYFQSGWKYAGTGHGWGWIEGSGNVDFARTSSSGTAGNTATLNTAIRINSNSEVLIGTTTDNGAYLLQVNSQIYATNATIATSDARFKTNVEALTDATAVIEALRPVAFDFIPHAERNFATERQVGLIAQETQSALAGTDYADSVVAQCGDHLGLAYEKLVPVLIKALQESNARIAALEERINA